MKECKNRNEQFENISCLKRQYEKEGNPIISVDTKKKEYIGNFYRDGKIYTRQTIETFDHDFNTFSEGIIIPHGLYDYTMNKGFINIGTSHETAEFACDSIKHWWKNYGKNDYHLAKSILLLCDCGGSNSSRHYIFKEQLQKLANEIGIEIRIAHYPPYCSKYNPIEHKMFPHVTRACQGVIFKSIEIVKNLMENTKTKKGLKVIVNVINKIYKTGKKVSENFKKIMTLKFDDYMPNWNYTAIPK